VAAHVAPGSTVKNEGIPRLLALTFSGADLPLSLKIMQFRELRKK
jgi:hypothetical protein